MLAPVTERGKASAGGVRWRLLVASRGTEIDTDEAPFDAPTMDVRDELESVPRALARSPI